MLIWNLLQKKSAFEYLIVTGLLLGFFVCILMQWIEIWADFIQDFPHKMHRTNKYVGFSLSIHEY